MLLDSYRKKHYSSTIRMNFIRELTLTLVYVKMIRKYYNMFSKNFATNRKWEENITHFALKS